MRILLTGATGFLGYRTLERLVESEIVTSIIATGRYLLSYRKVEHQKVKYMLGDLEDLSFCTSLFKEIDIVINTASLSSPWGLEQEFIKANIITQENLIKLSQLTNVKKFVYISTPSIYFNGNNRLLIKESDPLPLNYVNHYASTKRQAEILLSNSDLPFIILRPRAIIGRGDSVIMPRLIRAYDERKLKIIGDGKNIVDLTSVENVVESIHLSIIAKDEATNQIYNISNDEPVLLWEKISTILHDLDKKMPLSKIPYKIAFGVAKLLEFKSRYFNQIEPALTAYTVGTLAKSFTLDITKAKTLLGYRPLVNTQDSIDSFVKWYRQNENM
jgi:2-alkyl-3-oxoalkanoate reductase